MTDISSSDIRKKVPILKGDANYDAWSTKAKAVLITQALWKAVDPTVAIPTHHAARAKWEERDERAYGELYLLVSDEIQGLLEELSGTSGRAVWAFLSHKYATTNTPATRQSLRTKFYNLKHDPSLPVDTFITEVRHIAMKLKRIGHPYSDNELSDKILVSLHDSFTPIRTHLTNKSSQRDLDGICTALIEWEKQEFKAKFMVPTDVETANAAYRGSHRKGGKEYDWGNTKGRADACLRCGLQGHSAPTCIHDMPEDVKRRILSSNRSHSANVAQDYEEALAAFAHVTIDATSSGSEADHRALHAIANRYGEPIHYPHHAYHSSSPNLIPGEFACSAVIADIPHNFNHASFVADEGGVAEEDIFKADEDAGFNSDDDLDYLSM